MSVICALLAEQLQQILVVYLRKAKSISEARHRWQRLETHQTLILSVDRSWFVVLTRAYELMPIHSRCSGIHYDSRATFRRSDRILLTRSQTLSVL